VIDEATAARDGPPADRARALRRRRAEMHRIIRRDFFPPRHRELARAAVQALAVSDPADAVTEQEQS